MCDRIREMIMRAFIIRMGMLNNERGRVEFCSVYCKRSGGRVAYFEEEGEGGARSA